MLLLEIHQHCGMWLEFLKENHVGRWMRLGRTIGWRSSVSKLLETGQTRHARSRALQTRELRANFRHGEALEHGIHGDRVWDGFGSASETRGKRE